MDQEDGATHAVASQPVTGAATAPDAACALGAGLEQYEIVWIVPAQYQMSDCPDGVGTPEGFALEILDFLGPGDPDCRGQRTVWVRGPVIVAVSISGGVRFARGATVVVQIPHDQPRARHTGGLVLPPFSVLTSTPRRSAP